MQQPKPSLPGLGQDSIRHYGQSLGPPQYDQKMVSRPNYTFERKAEILPDLRLTSRDFMAWTAQYESLMAVTSPTAT